MKKYWIPEFGKLQTIFKHKTNWDQYISSHLNIHALNNILYTASISTQSNALQGKLNLPSVCFKISKPSCSFPSTISKLLVELVGSSTYTKQIGIPANQKDSESKFEVGPKMWNLKIYFISIIENLLNQSLLQPFKCWNM